MIKLSHIIAGEGYTNIAKKYLTFNYTGHQQSAFSPHKFHQAVSKHCACIKIHLTVNAMIASAWKS